MLQKNTVYLMMTSTLWMVKAVFVLGNFNLGRKLHSFLGVFLEDNKQLSSSVFARSQPSKVMFRTRGLSDGKKISNA
jgi:hypothetical protein